MTGVVLVTGPSSAGVTSMVRLLRDRVAGWTFLEAVGVETDGGEGGAAPAAVVFVVSAVAPVTESDCALVELVAAQTDVVIAVVSKIDDHRDWRDVLALNRQRLAGFTERFGHIPWVAAAAAPRLGEPHVSDLIALLADRLDDPESAHRNSLRAAEFRLRAAISSADAMVAERREQVDSLQDRRDGLLRQRLALGAEAAMALRSRIQHARVVLAFSVRNRCAALRTECRIEVAGPGRRPRADIEQRVLGRCRGLLAELDDEIDTRMTAVAADLGLAPPPRPAPARIAGLTDVPEVPGRLETQLIAVLGAGFGLGVTVMVSRLFAGLVPQAAIASVAVAAVVGMAVTVWVVKSRGLLQYRALLDRWVSETIGTVSSTAEERVATGVLAAEAALSPAYLAGVARRREALGRRIAVAVAELRDQECAIARAEAVREREVASLLEGIRALRDALAERRPDPITGPRGGGLDPNRYRETSGRRLANGANSARVNLNGKGPPGARVLADSSHEDAGDNTA